MTTWLRLGDPEPILRQASGVFPKSAQNLRNCDGEKSPDDQGAGGGMNVQVCKGLDERDVCENVARTWGTGHSESHSVPVGGWVRLAQAGSIAARGLRRSLGGRRIFAELLQCRHGGFAQDR
jgi:hypothetical protein